MKILRISAPFLFIILFILSHFSLVAKTSFWVSPEGNDFNPGTEQAPFQTLQKARDAVRELSLSAFSKDDVTVYLYGGMYRLAEPLELTPADSGRNGHAVIYCSVPGEYPTISGSIQVTGWSLYDPLLNIYRAQVGSNTSRQLYVNGKRAQRASTTAYPAGFRPSYSAGGIEFIPTPLNPPEWMDPGAWTNVPDIEAVIETQWKMMRVPLEQVTPSVDGIIPGLITLVEPAWHNANIYLDIITNEPGIWSFWQVTRFENALQFMNQPGDWCLDTSGGWLYYIPRMDENMNTALVELPILETLIQGVGTIDDPIHHIRFEGITFAYATWNGPSGQNGYVADQGGMILIGNGHQPTYIGHDPDIVPSHANLYFTFAHHIKFVGNMFKHLGGVGLHFDVGSQSNLIMSNLFTDISSSSILLGGVSVNAAHPANGLGIVCNNKIKNNLIRDIGVEYVDAAGILIGFTRETTISHNTIINVPWSAISMGWGWGLWDKGSFPGLPNAVSGQWGLIDSLTPNYGCVIANNRIESFLNILWDGGAIYTTGRQGPDFEHGLLIKENVALGKRPAGGGNTFYTDGGSRYITLKRNISFDNSIGIFYFGPPPQEGDPLPYPSAPSLANGLPYGDDLGGCITYGDIRYCGNYWRQSPIPQEEIVNNVILKLALGILAYSEEGFFDICRFNETGILYPINLRYKANHIFKKVADLPRRILAQAGVCKRPKTIPVDEWTNGMQLN